MKKFPEFCKYVNFPSTLPIIRSNSPSPFISPAVGEHQSFVKENFDEGDKFKLVSIHLGVLTDPTFFQNSIFYHTIKSRCISYLYLDLSKFISKLQKLKHLSTFLKCNIRYYIIF